MRSSMLPAVIRPLPLLVAALLPAAVASADVSGSWQGQLTSRAQQYAVSATLTQTGTAVSGTIALDPSDAPLGRPYEVTGKATARRLRLNGQNGVGAVLIWRGPAGASALTATVRLRGGGRRLVGRVRLTPSGTADPAACDAVFTQNQALFTDQVVGQVLTPTCAACHVQGGSAQAARLRITAGDPLATARAVALVIDPTSAANSLLLRKPLGQVSHGGGALLAAGSPAAQTLEQWATLVVQSQCRVGSGGGGGGSAFDQQCASCHGADGGGTATAPDVRCTAPAIVTDAVRHGRGGNAMPAFTTAELSAADLQAILDQLAASCSGTGADLYAANCASCHGPTGGGGQNADGVRGENIRCSDAGELKSIIRFGEERMPAFGSLGTANINKLATYVRSLCSLGGGGGGED